MKRFTRFLMWMILGLFLLTASFLSSITSVAAREEAYFAPRFSSTDTDNIYNEGDQIRINVNYAKKGLKVTADLSTLDSTFSKEYPIRDNKTGTYSLISPKLSGQTMGVGSMAISFKSVDDKGVVNTVLSTYLVNLQLKKIKANANLYAPARISESAGDGTVTIWWTPIENTDKIYIRYSNGSTIRQTTATKNKTGEKITNLDNGVEYEFFVAGMAKSGTIGPGKTIKSIPNGPVPIIEEQVKGEEVKAEKVSEKVKYIPPTIGEGKQVAIKQEEKTQENDIDQEIVPEEIEERNWNRLFLAISILIIAAGAAIGGYYAYEWYQARKDEPKSNIPKSKSRW